MSIDPGYVKRGCKVQLERGARLDSSMGPVFGGPEKVQAKDENGRPVFDDGGDGIGQIPRLIENPDPQPQGVVIGPTDQRGMCPVKWESDGAWSTVHLQSLELVEAVKADQERDPVKARAREIEAAHATATAAGLTAADAQEKIQAFEARLAKLEDAEKMRADRAAAMPKDPALGFVTRKELADTIAALTATRADTAKVAEVLDDSAKARAAADAPKG